MQLIAIFGPTAVGKTAVAVALAERLRARGERPVAVSADALQVYRGLETLTGVATAAQQRRLPHRLTAFLPVSEAFSAGRYARLAHQEIDRLLDEGCTPIVLGGTGLYLRAALTNLSLAPPPSPATRARRLAQLQQHGPEALAAELAQRAPLAAAQIDRRDGRRLARALELLDEGAMPKRDGPSELWTSHMRQPTLLIGLTMDRAALYQRIDARVEEIVAEGAVGEVRSAEAQGASATARAALGYQELLSGDIEAMKRRTRNYARRQLTWMRKLRDVKVLDVGQLGIEGTALRILALRELPGAGLK